MKYILIVLLLISCTNEEIVTIEKCNFESMNSIPYLDELTSCKCDCLCIGKSQKFCVTKNSKETTQEVILNGDFELGNQDWVATDDATITQDINNNWYGGISLLADGLYRGDLTQSFTITNDVACILRYNAFNPFYGPRPPEIESSVRVTITDSSNNVVFEHNTPDGQNESVFENLNLLPGTYNIQLYFSGATGNVVTQASIDNLSLECTLTEFLPCTVTLMPDNIELSQTDVSDSVFCVDVPESEECKWLEVSCQDITPIDIIPSLVNVPQNSGKPFPYEVDLECEPEFIVSVKLLEPHVGSIISFDGNDFNILNSPDTQVFNYTPTSTTGLIAILNGDSVDHNYEIAVDIKQGCPRKTIEFKTCDECEKGCLLEWTDKCTKENHSFYIPGDVVATSADFNAEEYLNSAGVLSLIGKNKTNKQYELITDGICNEIYCLIGEAMTQDNFKINGVPVIPTSSGSFDGVGSRNAVFSFKKAKLKDESCCC